MSVTHFSARQQQFPLNRTYVMGILNVTPDSFSDGGQYQSVECAVNHALEMEQEGADIIDIGGQSTRPGHIPVSAEQELSRVEPVLTALRGRLKIPMSIDTYEPLVASRALELGVCIINDVSGKWNPDMAHLVRSSGAGWILTDIQGDDASGIVTSVRDRLSALANQAIAFGIPPQQLCIDPGFGFAKDAQENVRLLLHLDQINPLQLPLLAGASRKRFVGWLTGEEKPENRDPGSVAVHLQAVALGAHFVRAHQVAMTVQAMRVADRLREMREHNDG